MATSPVTATASPTSRGSAGIRARKGPCRGYAAWVSTSNVCRGVGQLQSIAVRRTIPTTGPVADVPHELAGHDHPGVRQHLHPERDMLLPARVGQLSDAARAVHVGVRDQRMIDRRR